MRANLVGRSAVSAMTQTPASGPFGPVTTPPMSSASMATACAALFWRALSVTRVPRKTTDARPRIAERCGSSCVTWVRPVLEIAAFRVAQGFWGRNTQGFEEFEEFEGFEGVRGGPRGADKRGAALELRTGRITTQIESSLRRAACLRRVSVRGVRRGERAPSESRAAQSLGRGAGTARKGHVQALALPQS